VLRCTEVARALGRQVGRLNRWSCMLSAATPDASSDLSVWLHRNPRLSDFPVLDSSSCISTPTSSVSPHFLSVCVVNISSTELLQRTAFAGTCLFSTSLNIKHRTSVILATLPYIVFLRPFNVYANIYMYLLHFSVKLVLCNFVLRIMHICRFVNELCWWLLTEKVGYLLLIAGVTWSNV